MMTDHNCKKCATEHRATKERPYRFLDSGLSNVYLAGIRYWACPKCGKQAAEIPALEQLMSVMAKAVVMKPALLNGEEIRFLRKRLGKKAFEFAELINKTPEHFSKLENDQLPLPEETDKLIRFTYGLLSGDKQLFVAIAANAEAWLRSIRDKHTENITFRKKAASVWKPLSRAMAA
jgi:putative zinc finger/helix-turn-helix YgiT family protein